MDNKYIGNTTEASSEGIFNNCTEPNISHEKINSDLTEKTFHSILNSIKTDNYLPFSEESSDSEDSACMTKFFDDNNKKQQQNEMCDLASTSHEKYVNVSESTTSYEKDDNVSESTTSHEKDDNVSESTTSHEKDVNVSKSNLQELRDTKLVNGKMLNLRTSSLSSALPIMKILSPKSGPHTCFECCFKCNNVFRILDSPLHIQRIRSIDKQNEFLKIEPTLCVDSCLCDFCWKDLEKTFKSNKSKNRKEESYSEKKSRLLERYVKKNISKNQNQSRKCSIHLCSQPYSHKMSVNEYENIKELFSTFEFCRLVFVQSTKQTTDYLKFPFCLCHIHKTMILVLSACQICGDKLNPPFNTDDWSMHEMWNCVLIENKLPLVLKPGMFICATCKEHLSKTNPGFPINDFPRLREYILISNATRLKVYGESQNNLSNICQESTDVASAIVFPKNKEKKKCVRSTKVKFSDLLKTKISNLEIDNDKNDTESITSTALLNVDEQNLCTTILQPKDKGLDFVSVEPSNAITIPVSIKRKQSNVICGTVSNKDGKKHRLNEKHSSFENNSTDDNTTKSYRNKNIAHQSIKTPSNLNMTSNCQNQYGPNPDILDSEMSSETDSEEILQDYEIKETDYIVVASDDDLSLDSNCELIKSKFEIKQDHEIEMDCTFVSDSEKSLNCKIKLNGENLLENYTTNLDSVKDSNCEMVRYAKTESDSDKQSDKNISVTQEEFNNKKLSVFEIVSNVQKGSDSKILLNGEKVEIVSKSENRKAKYEIKPSGYKKSKFIIILDNEKEFINKNLSTFKIVSNVKKGSDYEMLLDGEKVYDIESDSWNRKIKYMIVSKDKIKSSFNKRSQCTIISDNEEKFNNKKSTFKMLVKNVQKGSHFVLLDDEKSLQNPINYSVQFPVGVKKTTVSKNKVLLPPVWKLKN